MTHDDDTRDLVRRAGDAVPVTPAPVQALLQQGRGARRRRTVTVIGVVAASVAVITSGAVAVGSQLTRDANTQAASSPTISDGTLIPSPGTRLVGRNGIAVAVPADWRTSPTLCRGDVDVWQIPESYRGPIGCAPHVSTDSGVSIQSYRDQAHWYEPWAQPAGGIGGVTVQRYGPLSSCLHSLGICGSYRMNRYIGVLLAKDADVLIYVESTSQEEVSQILDTAFAVPSGYVTMTPPASSTVPTALRAAGLHVTEHVLYQGELPEGSLLNSHPSLGTVVARGSDVTVVVSTRHHSAHCWAAPVDVVTPTTTFRPSQGYSFRTLTVHVGDHLNLRTIGPCGDDAYFIRPSSSVLARLDGRDVIASRPGSTRLVVVRPGAPGIGDVEVRVRP